MHKHIYRIQKAMECWLVIYYSYAFKTLSKNTEINQHILSDAKGHSGNDHSEQIAVGAQFVERTNKRFNEIGTHIRSSSITLLVSVELANKYYIRWQNLIPQLNYKNQSFTADCKDSCLTLIRILWSSKYFWTANTYFRHVIISFHSIHRQFNGLFDLFQSIGDLLLLQKTEAMYDDWWH